MGSFQSCFLMVWLQEPILLGNFDAFVLQITAIDCVSFLWVKEAGYLFMDGTTAQGRAPIQPSCPLCLPWPYQHNTLKKKKKQKLALRSKYIWSDMVMHTSNPSTWKAEVVVSPWVQGQPGLYSEKLSQKKKKVHANHKHVGEWAYHWQPQQTSVCSVILLQCFSPTQSPLR